ERGQLGCHAHRVKRLRECFLNDVLTVDDGAGDARAVAVKQRSNLGHERQKLLARLPEFGRNRSWPFVHRLSLLRFHSASIAWPVTANAPPFGPSSPVAILMIASATPSGKSG